MLFATFEKNKKNKKSICLCLCWCESERVIESDHLLVYQNTLSILFHFSVSGPSASRSLVCPSFFVLCCSVARQPKVFVDQTNATVRVYLPLVRVSSLQIAASKPSTCISTQKRQDTPIEHFVQMHFQFNLLSSFFFCLSMVCFTRSNCSRSFFTFFFSSCCSLYSWTKSHKITTFKVFSM